jgi:hypothetical protein
MDLKTLLNLLENSRYKVGSLAEVKIYETSSPDKGEEGLLVFDIQKVIIAEGKIFLIIYRKSD